MQTITDLQSLPFHPMPPPHATHHYLLLRCLPHTHARTHAHTKKCLSTPREVGELLCAHRRRLAQVRMQQVGPRHIGRREVAEKVVRHVLVQLRALVAHARNPRAVRHRRRVDPAPPISTTARVRAQRLPRAAATQRLGRVGDEDGPCARLRWAGGTR
eukprot:274631-Chlamydomonas_euryale.AAC.2